MTTKPVSPYWTTLGAVIGIGFRGAITTWAALATDGALSASLWALVALLVLSVTAKAYKPEVTK